MKKNIITFNSPKDPISEAFRNMRTNIVFSDIDGELKVMTITSSGKSEGKSTILSNYAVALAQSNKKVLLMDCDLRRPVIHKLFDRRNRVGLTNVLLKEADIKNAIQLTEVEGLHIISSGPIPPNPSEILASKRMGDLVDLLKQAYDYILIDAPPVGVVTDAAVLSRVTDGYILVAALSVASKDGVKMAIETLENVGGHIIGVVANNIPQNKRSGYYYYYTYQNSYENADKAMTREEKRQDKRMKRKQR
jgi:capsular exopolysaccharide synthesis family protein